MTPSQERGASTHPYVLGFAFMSARAAKATRSSAIVPVIYLLLAFVLHRVSGIGARDAPNAFGIKQLENGRLAGSWVDCDTGVTHTTACFAAGFTLMYDVLGNFALTSVFASAMCPPLVGTCTPGGCNTRPLIVQLSAVSAMTALNSTGSTPQPQITLSADGTALLEAGGGHCSVRYDLREYSRGFAQTAQEALDGKAFMADFAAAPFGCWHAPNSGFSLASVGATSLTDFDGLLAPVIGVFSAGFLLQLFLTTNAADMDVATLGVTDWDRKMYGRGWDARLNVAPSRFPATFVPSVFRSAGAIAPFGSSNRLEFFVPTYLFQLPSTAPLMTQFGDFSVSSGVTRLFSSRCPYVYAFRTTLSGDVVQSGSCGGAQPPGSLRYLEVTQDAIGGIPGTSLAAALLVGLMGFSSPDRIAYAGGFWDRTAGRLKKNGAANSTWFVPSDAAVNRFLIEVGLPPGRDGISILLNSNSTTVPGATMFSNPYDGYMFKNGVTLPSLLLASLNGYSFVIGASLFLSGNAQLPVGPFPTILATYPQAVIPAIVRAGGEGGGFGLVVVGANNNVTVVKADIVFCNNVVVHVVDDFLWPDANSNRTYIASLLRGTWNIGAADAQGRDSLLPAKVVPAVVGGTAVLAAVFLVMLRRRAPVGGLHSACCASTDADPAAPALVSAKEEAAAKGDQVVVKLSDTQKLRSPSERSVAGGRDQRSEDDRKGAKLNNNNGVLNPAIIPASALEVGDPIGRGASAIVYKASWSGTLVAVKVWNSAEPSIKAAVAANANAGGGKWTDSQELVPILLHVGGGESTGQPLPAGARPGDFTQLQQFRAEVQHLMALRHPNILQFFGVFPPLTLVMELGAQGSLKQALEAASALDDTAVVPLPWRVRTKIASGLAAGMSFLHDTVPCIVHRDLKPGNVILDANYVPKVADFGLSIQEARLAGAPFAPVGTLRYMAPEILEEYRSTQPSIPTAIDVYAYGWLLCDLKSPEEKRRRARHLRDCSSQSELAGSSGPGRGVDLAPSSGEDARSAGAVASGGVVGPVTHDGGMQVSTTVGIASTLQRLKDDFSMDAELRGLPSFFADVARECCRRLPEDRPNFRALRARVHEMEERASSQTFADWDREARAFEEQEPESSSSG